MMHVPLNPPPQSLEASRSWYNDNTMLALTRHQRVRDHNSFKLLIGMEMSVFIVFCSMTPIVLTNGFVIIISGACRVGGGQSWVMD